MHSKFVLRYFAPCPLLPTKLRLTIYYIETDMEPTKKKLFEFRRYASEVLFFDAGRMQEMFRSSA